ncbi:hypothetical protein [Flavobacterium sp.]|uniref:hypothetical protein n=1 Tax=Flavobacterium sp. TaxID=239 RepID=UPI002634EA66|nr:hypothetical protein [Flavobacterium sp.]
MERLVNHESSANAVNAVLYERAAAQLEKETEKPEVLSCNQLVKNLLKTNLKLLKLNEISSILLF